jgi:hypothetical protein
MKKKLQLNKEIVSILDRNQMNLLTKGGDAVSIPCLSNPCIDHSEFCNFTKNALCETYDQGLCASATKCDTDACPIETGNNCETLNIDCMIPVETNACPVKTVINCE